MRHEKECNFRDAAASLPAAGHAARSEPLCLRPPSPTCRRMPDATFAPDRLHALVPCAGSGARAGAGRPKQHVVVAGRTVLAHTLVALAEVQRLASILVVLAPGDAGGESLANNAVDDPRVTVARCGGATRAETVANGLDALR